MNTPQKSPLKSSHPPKKNTCQIFLPKEIPESKTSNPKKSFDHPRHLKSGVPASRKIASKGKFKHPYHLRPLCHSQAIPIIFLFLLLILTLNYHTLFHPHHQTTLINVGLLLIRSLFPSTATHSYHHRPPSYAHPNLIIFMLS